MKTLLIISIVFIVFITSCARSRGSRTFSRYGLEFQIPRDWRDSHGPEDLKQFGFRDASGQIGFGMEKLPGQWDKYLSYSRGVRSPAHKEEEIYHFGNLPGKGYRVYTLEPGNVSEAVFFAPTGELEGWFMVVSLSSNDPKLREELFPVVNSLRAKK